MPSPMTTPLPNVPSALPPAHSPLYPGESDRHLAGMPRRCLSLCLAATLLGLCGCTAQEGAAIATTSAVVVGGTLGVAASTLTGRHDTQRLLDEPRLYELSPGRFVITNQAGWFTDKSERKADRSALSRSAWVVDLTTAKPEPILRLSPDNLVRWFWNDHQPDS